MRLTTNWIAVAIALVLAATPSLGLAQAAEGAAVDAAKSADTAYIFNTVLFLMGGFLVMFMAAGFCMLECGLVRSKNVAMQATKNILLYSIASIMFFVVGYVIMYPGAEDWIIKDWLASPGLKVIEEAGKGVVNADTSYAAGSDFFFQLVFCAATASIVSGTVAERIKLWPFLIFVVVLTGFIYPIQASWSWGGGYLKSDDFAALFGAKFQDFAGSTIVHSVGGWAALAGAIILGARLGKYKDGKVLPMPGSSLPLATLGTFILWLGWFGFNGGSQLAMGTVADVTDVAKIFVNTNTAAAAGAVSAAILTQLFYGKVDITMVLNGALAGLVSITAEPLQPGMPWACVVGAVGGVIVVLTVPLLDSLKIDDVVGAIPVHLFAGIWGTLAVVGSNSDASIAGQIAGILIVGVFTFVASMVVWVALKATVGIRPSEEEEDQGLDNAEIGMEAYPEFSKTSTQFS